MKERDYINRKEIAQLLSKHDVNPKQVERSERLWGLVSCKFKQNARVVVYRRLAAIAALRAFGFEIDAKM